MVPGWLRAIALKPTVTFEDDGVFIAFFLQNKLGEDVGDRGGGLDKSIINVFPEVIVTSCTFVTSLGW